MTDSTSSNRLRAIVRSVDEIGWPDTGYPNESDIDQVLDQRDVLAGRVAELETTDGLPTGGLPLACPKCGFTDTSLAYCYGRILRPWSAQTGDHVDNVCHHGDPEHFHRLCRRCRYEWRTDDVIDTGNVCQS